MADELTPKGHTFTKTCRLIPRSIREGDPERLARHIEAQNARWRIVDECKLCDPPRPLVAEEVAAHRLNHVPEDIRPMARDLAAMAPERRRDLLGLFVGKGAALKD